MSIPNPRSHQYVSILNSDFETRDRALQQRVRRFHTKLDKGIINADTLNDIEKEFDDHKAFAKKACTFFTKSTDPFLAVKNCSDKFLEAGFAKLSKREPFAGKLIPGEQGHKWEIIVDRSGIFISGYLI